MGPSLDQGTPHHLQAGSEPSEIHLVSQNYLVWGNNHAFGDKNGSIQSTVWDKVKEISECFFSL